MRMTSSSLASPTKYLTTKLQMFPSNLPKGRKRFVAWRGESKIVYDAINQCFIKLVALVHSVRIIGWAAARVIARVGRDPQRTRGQAQNPNILSVDFKLSQYRDTSSTHLQVSEFLWRTRISSYLLTRLKFSFPPSWRFWKLKQNIFHRTNTEALFCHLYDGTDQASNMNFSCPAFARLVPACVFV